MSWDKPLFKQLRAEDKQKAFFTSSFKIERALELHQQKEQTEEAEQAHKQQETINWTLRKQLKEQQLIEQKIERKRK